jgi:hypothetical protein
MNEMIEDGRRRRRRRIGYVGKELTMVTSERELMVMIPMDTSMRTGVPK